ncbi:fibrinogen silencer-binding protein [Spea bombifrons]|uniref:fibrinogen silencer-binding protein n=1 Tax=Spea bombifrons TaxID=233779 RepID=UPI00234BF8E6|nr:fibrinogen silencer-binding protein [Spea bombifrons]
MVGKARSSNFTVFEKLDLLELVKPYIGVLEEHTNKHSVIIEKNNCWEIIAEKYNAMGAGRPPRTAQGLRTLYKRLKEYGKQELLQCKTSQAGYQSSVSEATKKLVEIIPQFGNVCFSRDVNGVPSESVGSETDPGISSQHIPLQDQMVSVTVQLEQEEDVKPPPSLLLNPPPATVRDEPDDHAFDHELDRSLSPTLSSVDMRLSLSPPVPRIEECFSHTGERLRSTCGCNPETLQMARKEHQIILSNQRQYGLYIKEKREGLKRRQHLEEELLKAKIKVEKLKAMKLRRDLPEYSNL